MTLSVSRMCLATAAALLLTTPITSAANLRRAQAVVSEGKCSRTELTRVSIIQGTCTRAYHLQVLI